MVDLNVDFLQIQRRAVDIPAMKLKYGDKIGFNVTIEGTVPGLSYTNAEITPKIHDTIELYGKNGGAYINVFETDPEKIWHITSETYAFSREFYDHQRSN
jgi:hypothetical protein